MAVALGVLVLIAVAGTIGVTTWYLRRPDAPALPDELGAQRAALRARLGALADHLAALADGRGTHLSLSHGEAGNAASACDTVTWERGRLAEAEAGVAGEPENPAARAALALALLDAGHPEAAAAEATGARARGGDGPVLDFVEGWAGYLAAARATGDGEQAHRGAPLLTRAELTVLAGERSRRAAAADGSPAFSDHLRRGQSALARVLDAAETRPTPLAPVHAAARLAIKVALIDEGRALLEQLAPLAAGNPDAAEIDRDLRQLRDDDIAGEVRRRPPLRPGGRRSPQLKILR